MNSFTIALVLSYLLISLILTAFRVRIFWFLGISLIASQILCVYDIIIREPAQIVWLCNIAVFLNIFLLFKFVQKVFDLYFCFAWIGCFFICMMPTNPYSLMIKDLPLIWIAYWVKHLAPLIMTIYFLRVEKKKLSYHMTYTGVVGFLVYCSIIYFYNKFLDKNVLYLNHPAPFMAPLGRYYFWIAVPLGYFWVALVETACMLMNAVKDPKRTFKIEAKAAKLIDQSNEGS